MQSLCFPLVSALRASVVVATATFCASSASGAVISFTQQFVWEFYASNEGAALSLETFDSYNGFYASPLTGSAGDVQWSASATGGIFVGSAAGGQALSTNNAVPMTISFSGAPLRGVGGNFFGTDINFNVVSALVQLSLADGSSYIAVVNSATTFAGFYSTGSFITGLTISTQPAPGGVGDVYPTVDNLRFASVPAPSALALWAFSAIGSSRRKRR
jgi:hypothetical protein